MKEDNIIDDSQIQNNIYITRKEFEWGCLYSTILKSYPNKKPYFLSVKFNKLVEPDRTKYINKINVKRWFLTAYEDKRDGSVKPVLFVNDYDDLTEDQNNLEYENDFMIISDEEVQL